MARWHFGATKLDRRVAKAVARNASPAVERPARLLTWAADEYVLYMVAGGLWLAARMGDPDRSSGAERRRDRHPAHLLKRLIDQERPDRCMVHGPRHGIPRSGNAYDAFPSGHAMHVGAVASAVSWADPKSAPIAWGLGGLIAATRIVVLAHWMTDVLAGMAMGAVVERCLRPLSKGAIRSTSRRACTGAPLRMQHALQGKNATRAINPALPRNIAPKYRITAIP